MGFKKIVDYYVLGKSLKEIEMNRILDKIHRKVKITPKQEYDFLIEVKTKQFIRAIHQQLKF